MRSASVSGEVQPPTVTENLGSEMCGFYREIGIFAHADPGQSESPRVRSRAAASRSL